MPIGSFRRLTSVVREGRALSSPFDGVTWKSRIAGAPPGSPGLAPESTTYMWFAPSAVRPVVIPVGFTKVPDAGLYLYSRVWLCPLAGSPLGSILTRSGGFVLMVLVGEKP